MENKLYLNIDSELPFDILVYNQAEWDNLLKDEMSFASRINSLGRFCMRRIRHGRDSRKFFDWLEISASRLTGRSPAD